MLVDADLDEIITGKRGMLSGIDGCLETQCFVSAVALIYSTIDALSALTRPIDVPDNSDLMTLIADSERMEDLTTFLIFGYFVPWAVLPF